MLFTGAFTVNRWRLTIGSKTGDKLSESSDRLRLSTIENGSQTSGRGAFYGHRRRAGNASRWCITLDSYATLTLRPCVHARAICISVINVCACQMRAVQHFRRKRWNSRTDSPLSRPTLFLPPRARVWLYDPRRRSSSRWLPRTRKRVQGCPRMDSSRGGGESYVCVFPRFFPVSPRSYRSRLDCVSTVMIGPLLRARSTMARVMGMENTRFIGEQ